MLMTRRALAGAIGAFILLSVIVTVVFHHYTMDIAGVIDTGDPLEAPDSAAAAKPVVRISVISRYPPYIINSGYQPMMDYMTAHSAYRFELTLCSDYTEAVDMLLRGEAAAAFLGSFVYITARRQHGVIPILKPLNSNNEPFSRSVLFTTGTSGITTVAGLRGRTLALPSSESYSANWFLSGVLHAHQLHREDLTRIQHFPHHQSVIHQVAAGMFDAGVTREQLVETMPAGSIRILLYSDPFPTSPLVVAAGHDTTVIRAIREVLLVIGRNPTELPRITRGWDREFTHGFVEADDRDYDAIRAIGIR